MKNYNRGISVISKVLEILHWVGVASMIVLLVCSVAAKSWLADLFLDGTQNISTYGFSLSLHNADGTTLFLQNTDGTTNMTAIRICAIGTFLELGLMAMIFRNVYLISRTVGGKSKFAKASTPFQTDIIHKIREIGIFSILIPMLGLLVTVIAQLICGTNHIEVSVNFNSIITGILVLSLTQVFTYGTKLEKETEGLI